tara:strand:- start:3614 stop:3850 length:237 start_codon:yes stop_codon:yes gene_type:complete
VLVIENRFGFSPELAISNIATALLRQDLDARNANRTQAVAKLIDTEELIIDVRNNGDGYDTASQTIGYFFNSERGSLP